MVMHSDAIVFCFVKRSLIGRIIVLSFTVVRIVLPHIIIYLSKPVMVFVLQDLIGLFNPVDVVSSLDFTPSSPEQPSFMTNESCNGH